MHTICYKCGTPKRFVDEACPSCSFEPSSIAELARARILSEPYCFTLADGTGFETGRPAQELESIAREIAKGVAYEFPPDELDNVKQIMQIAESTTASHLAVDFLKLVGPALGLLVTLVLILWLL